MLRRLYHWTLHWSAHPRAEAALFWLSFAESSVFPLPPDLLLIAMCLSRREKSMRYAFLCTAGGVLGGVLGYGIGYFLFETVGQWVVHVYGLEEAFAQFQSRFHEWGWWVVLAGAFTPIPYKLIAICSGVVGLDLGVFALASLIGRGSRFYIEAALLHHYGAPIRRFIERYMGLLTIGFFALLLGGFLMLKFLT